MNELPKTSLEKQIKKSISWQKIWKENSLSHLKAKFFMIYKYLVSGSK